MTEWGGISEFLKSINAEERASELRHNDFGIWHLFEGLKGVLLGAMTAVLILGLFKWMYVPVEDYEIPFVIVLAIFGGIYKWIPNM